MKKGIEGLPFNIVISLIIVSIVVSISLFEIQSYKNFNDKRVFLDSVKNILDSFNNLKIGDEGSFISVNITIPKDEFLIFSNETNKIITKDRNFTLNVNLINNMTLSSGYYQIILYYGNPQELKDLMICFK